MPVCSYRTRTESKLLLSDEALKAEFLRDHKLEYANFLKCKKIFHDVASGYFRRILQFVTNDPDPVLDKAEKYQSVTEVKTFPASDIRFELVTMREDFDYDLFYKEVFKALGVELVEEICLDSEGLMDKFSKLVDPKMKQQKMQFYPFKGDTEADNSRENVCAFYNGYKQHAINFCVHWGESTKGLGSSTETI